MRIVCVVCLAVGLVCARPAEAQTESPVGAPTGRGGGTLRIAALTWSATATADWATTYRFSSRYRDMLREDNPLLAGLDRHPVLLVVAGSAIDAGVGWATYRFVGRRHPRLATIAFLGAAAYRAYLAGYNLQNIERARAARRR